MRAYFDRARTAIEKHGGTVEKFAGDAVMAVFGVPVAHEDDALRALRAAVDVRTGVADLSADLRRRFGFDIHVQIGVNSGEAVASDARSAETFVTGPSVNLAQRFQSVARAGEIIFGAPTFQLVRNQVEAEELEPLVLKGVERPTEAFRLVSLRRESRERRGGDRQIAPR